MYKTGDKVRVREESETENYDSFKNKVLIITHIARGIQDYKFYDESMNGMQLMDFKTLDGKDINCSLYEYEICKV